MEKIFAKKEKIVKKYTGILLAFVLCFSFAGCSQIKKNDAAADLQEQIERLSEQESYSLDKIPEYAGEPYVVLNDNEPSFKEDEITDESYESYSGLDELGRCRAAEASVGQDIMPTEKRGSIGQVKPTGWHTVKYDCVDGNYLYNRCHLLGYQLTGENANEENLITGTRYMNVDGMLPVEDMVADYVKETGDHVMYRVTPVFEGDNLVASGVEMEAYSVEDEGEGISFHVFCYNVQPEVEIDYQTGESEFVGKEEEDKTGETEIRKYVLNTNTKKFHKPECASVEDTAKANKKTEENSREELIKQGYKPCGRCKP